MSGASWFDPTQYDPSMGDGQFPIGTFPVIIKSSRTQAVKDKPNEGLLVFSCDIIDGPHKGGSGPIRLNIWNGNPQAVEIAQRQLSAICHVTGTYGLRDTVNRGSELFGKPFVVIVQSQPNDDKRTQVVGFLDMNGNPPVKAGTGPAPQGHQPPPPQQPAPAAPAWGSPSAAVPAQLAPASGAPAWGQQAPQTPATPATSAPGWGAQSPSPPQGGTPSWSQQPAPAAPAWGR